MKPSLQFLLEEERHTHVHEFTGGGRSACCKYQMTSFHKHSTYGRTQKDWYTCEASGEKLLICRFTSLPKDMVETPVFLQGFSALVDEAIALNILSKGEADGKD